MKNYFSEKEYFEKLRSEVLTKCENWREPRRCELTNSQEMN